LSKEGFRTLYLDPGEDFGWCVGLHTKLLSAGTDKMWNVALDAWAAIHEPGNPLNQLNSMDYAREGVTEEELTLPIGRFVIEDFRIYPWKLKALKFDRVRTARVIGAFEFMSRLLDIPLVHQGANIKKAAQAAGAEELYYKPLHENRHQNDAIQHFVFFTNVELLGLPLPIPPENEETTE
jgi:hypothetical protein